MSSSISERLSSLFALTLLLAAVVPAAAQPENDALQERLPGLSLQLVTAGLSGPISVAHAGDGSGRLFIVQQDGQIRIWTGSTLLATPFLDIDPLTNGGGEQGLLGLAFHPNYAVNGLFYVHYTDNGGDTVIAEYSVSAGDPNIANSGSGDILLTQNQPFGNHNGGQIAFGPDGYLYIGIGDGGSGGDPLNSGQTGSTLLGKLLRIDVDGDDFPGNANKDYAIPADNPFVGNASFLDEIWAWGLRNPWRFSFDRTTGDLFIGDVGQNAWEEVSFQPASSAGGENYGWRRMEGFHCFNPATNCNDGSLTLPILEYNHSGGHCSITGGYRYRGSTYPNLAGVLLYGDFCSGQIWGATPDTNGDWLAVPLLDAPFNISTFGEDESGELYVVDIGGSLYRVVDSSQPNQLFDDGFESGDLTSWAPGSETDGGDLAATLAAALAGTFGLEALIDDTTRLFVLDESPNDEVHYRARFYFDPNTLTLPNNKRFKMLTAFSEVPSRRLATLVLRFSGGEFFLRFKGHLDDNSWAQLAWVNLGNQQRVIEIEWLKSTSVGASNGYLRLWVDGVLQETVTGLDFDNGDIDFLRLGAIGGIDVGTAGSFYLDSFVSHRHQYIGP